MKITNYGDYIIYAHETLDSSWIKWDRTIPLCWICKDFHYWKAQDLDHNFIDSRDNIGYLEYLAAKEDQQGD